MPTITIENFPDELYQLVQRSAAMSRRSISSEIIVRIQRTSQAQPINPQEFLVIARNLRKKTTGHRLSEQELAAAKNSGRL